MIYKTSAYLFEVNETDTAVIVSARPRHGDLAHHFTEEALIVPSGSDGASALVQREVDRLRRNALFQTVAAFLLGVLLFTILAVPFGALVDREPNPGTALTAALLLGGCASVLAWIRRPGIRLLDLPMRVPMFAENVERATISGLTASERGALERARAESPKLFLVTLQLIQQRRVATATRRQAESDRELHESAEQLLEK